MNETIYLTWLSYKENRTIHIGQLIKTETGYLFKYFKEAKLAKEHGCVLPFYTKTYDEVISFNQLPNFFTRRLPLYIKEYKNMDVYDVLISLNIFNIQDNFYLTILPQIEKEHTKKL